MPFKVIPVTGLSQDTLNDIANFLCKSYQDAVTARGQQIDSDYQRWEDNYNAKPAQEVRSTPWVGASNFVPQLTRMHTDILTARILGIMLGTRPFWRPSTFNSEWKSAEMTALAQYMEMKSNYGIDLPTHLDLIVSETNKTGTTTAKCRWQEEEEWVVRGENEQTKIEYNDLEMDIVPFYDFFPYPITARSIEKTIARHSRLRLTKEEIDYRVGKQIWDRDAAQLLINGGTGRPNVQEEQQAARQNIALTPDVTRPFTSVECSFTYPLAGKNMRLIAVFNPQVRTGKGILRLYYSYFSDPKLDMYVDFRLIRRLNSYYGIGIPEILEQTQEEQAQIHNGRRDSNTIANVPTFLKKRYSLNNFTPASEWYPGKVWEVDDMNDIKPLELGGNYNSMIDEENNLLQLAERYTGVSQPMQGMGTGVMGKKGTYNTGGTLALLAEGNRRLDIYIKRMRAPFHRLGKIMFTSYRDFGDPEELKQWGENGQLVQKIFAYGTTSPQYRNLQFDFTASDAGANKEVDRQALLLMSNTMSAYYQQVMALSQAVAGMPPGSPAQLVALAVLDGAHDLATRLLTAFDIADRKTLVPDVRKLLGSAGAPVPTDQPEPGGPGGAQPDVPDARQQAILGGAQAASSFLGTQVDQGRPQ